MSKDEISAFLGAGTEYTGDLSFRGAVRIDGVFKGNITSEGALIAGKDAQIYGEARVGELILAGTFEGVAHAARRAIIHKGGLLKGTLYAEALVVEEGGKLHAEIHVPDDSPSPAE